MTRRTWARLAATLAAWVVLAAGCGAKGVERPVAGERQVDPRSEEPVASDTGDEESDPPTSTDTGTDPGGVTPGPDGFRGELTDWETCEGGDFECATLAVPLDWDQPGGETLDLAVIRKTAPSDPIGSVVFNPGGPGGSGKDFLVDFTEAGRLPEGLDEEFDLVSWDPRGTGESAPIDCTTVSELEEPDLDPTPDTPRQAAAIETDHGESLATCRAQVGELFSEVGTVDTARDLDALRYALGEDQLTYVGYSYGTTLGMEYLRRFPEHVRAMVLDGVSIPGEDVVEATRFQGQSFEDNLEAFLADCGDSCTFGDGDPRAALVELIARLEAGERIPAEYSLGALSRTGTVGIGELYAAVVQAMYERDLWPILEMALTQATDPVEPNAGLLLLLRDLLSGRGEDGEWDPIGDANAAINCADIAVRPPSAVGDPAIRAEFTDELPLLGGFFAAGTPPCAGFPAADEPLAPVTASDFDSAPPVVIVSTTMDPATPYEAGVEAQQLLPGSVLVTYDDAVHTGYGRGVGCVDDPVTDYLVTLEVPDAGLRCEP